MNIDELTLGQVKELRSVFDYDNVPTQHPYEIGKNYLIRTVTHYLTGKLIRVTQQELVLENAAWIADTGRYADALKSGELKEVEPYPDELVVGRGAIIDAAIWKHPLPRDQK